MLAEESNIHKKILYIKARGGIPEREGTGLLISCRDRKRENQPEYNIIVTCRHVVADGDKLASEIMVWPEDTSSEERHARHAEAVDTQLKDVTGDVADLIILKLKKSAKKIAQTGFQEYAELERETQVSVYGFPLGRMPIEIFEGGVVRFLEIPGQIARATSEGIYTFIGNQTAPGLSGGPVLNEHQVLGGIWRGKYNHSTSEWEEGVIISAYWIWKLCDEAGYDFPKFKEKTNPIPQKESVPKKIFREIEEVVKKKIAEIIESQELVSLKTSLVDQIKKQDKENEGDIDIKDWLDRLDSRDLCEGIAILDDATRESFEKIKEEGGNRTRTEKIWNGATQILGWMVLLSVDYEWIDQKKFFEKSSKEIELEIPVKSAGGVEILFSFLTKSPAQLDVPNPGGTPCGKDEMKYKIPEGGWESSDTVATIKQLLWRKVYPEEEIPAPFTTYHNQKLNRTLERRNRKKEHLYLAVKAPQRRCSPFRTEVYRQLKTELPDLHFIVISTYDDNAVFVVSESTMEADLIEFFRNKPE